MSQSINLIPQQEQMEQQQVKLVKLSTVLAVLFLLLVIGISVFYFTKTKGLKDEIATHDQSIASLRSQITGMAAIEIVARNLDTKSKVLQQIFDSRPYYSLLLKEFKHRVPPTVLVQSFTMTTSGSFSLSGDSDNYISISGFIDDLTNPNFADTPKELQTLFTTVSLNSVSLETRNNRASYFMNVTYDASKLKK